MLQLCDKGAALFADRYLPTHLAATVSENSSSRESHSASMDKSNRGILGPLIKSIIVDNVADADPAMARRSLLLIKYVTSNDLQYDRDFIFSPILDFDIFV